MTKIDKDVSKSDEIGILSKDANKIASFEASLDIKPTLLNY